MTSDYAATLEIPFVFSSNGDGFVFHDRTGTSAIKEENLGLDAFPSPGDLWARYRAWKGLTAEDEQVVLQDYFDDGSGKAPRYYQVNVLASLASRRKRHLHIASPHPAPAQQKRSRATAATWLLKDTAWRIPEGNGSQGRPSNS
jgi:hypothetical protein